MVSAKRAESTENDAPHTRRKGSASEAARSMLARGGVCGVVRVGLQAAEAGKEVVAEAEVAKDED